MPGNVIQDPKGKILTLRLPADNTLIHRLTLRMDNGHEPVEQKARGEKGVTQLMARTDNNSKAYRVP